MYVQILSSQDLLYPLSLVLTNSLASHLPRAGDIVLDAKLIEQLLVRLLRIIHDKNRRASRSSTLS